MTHEPIFVHTAETEFNYPSGADNVKNTLRRQGRIPDLVASPCAWPPPSAKRDPNILLTNYLTGESRMMIRRTVRERLETLAGFIRWDADPYLVITDRGRLVWMVDGYTTSSGHPYSRRIQIEGFGAVNYIRNSVKATVDAYDGSAISMSSTRAIRLSAPSRTIFPRLFPPASDMPADLRAHARYPETLFRVQAEIYRTFHMLDPQAFYNKEDLWDLARTV